LVSVLGCGQDCAVNEYGDVILGDDAFDITCNVGTSTCEKVDGKMAVVCPDWLPISQEVCDPEEVDEDCDGYTNDVRYSSYDHRNSCGTGLGECFLLEQVCENGEMQCRPVSVFAGEEVCDGRDNDCDGFIDDADPDLTYDDDYAYSGPAHTLNVGECRAGVLRCEAGREYLFGEVRPTAEICGNFDDDDCDGFVDEDDNANVADAIRISLDFSGSMTTVFEAVAIALDDWSGNLAFTNSRFQIQAVGGRFATYPYILNLTEFVTANEAADAMWDFYNQYNLPGGIEYVPYGIWAANDPDDFLYSEWPEHMRRRVIFFTDETPQGNGVSPESDLMRVTDDCLEHNYTVGGFVTSDYALWRIMTDACGGWLETLVNDPTELREDLDDRFGSECGG
jgi:hypothetical protein